MKNVYLCFLFFLIMKDSFPQVPILFYDFESNTTRSVFDNNVELSINSGGGPITRVGSGTIASGYGDNGRGKSLWGYNWQNVTSDPGSAATEYYQFSVNTTGFKGITVRFRDIAPYSYSPGSVGCNYSINGTTFKTAGSNSTSAPNSNWNDAAIELFNFPEVNNNSNLIIRLYGYKGFSSNSNGLLAIDNLVISADTIISGAGEISLLNETDFFNSYYSGGSGSLSYTWKKNLVMNGPGTTVNLMSPINFSQKIIINDGCSLKCGIYPVWGTCSFTLNKNGKIFIGSSGGIVSGTDSVGNVCVKGTRIYSSGADYYYNGNIQQVTGNGLPASVNVLGINNLSGVNLSGSLLVADTLKLQKGNLILGNNDITLNDTSVAAGGSSASYIVTNSLGGMVVNKMTRSCDVKFPVGTADSYNPVIINYTGTLDTFRVKVKQLFDNAPLNPDKVVNRQWTISENTVGGSNAAIKFGWIQGEEAPGFNVHSSVMMGRWNGTSWNQTQASVSGSGTIDDQYIVTASGFTNFSNFGIGNDGALPVELNYFGFTMNERDIMFNWETATEKNSDKFDIEKNVAGNNVWENVASVKASFVSSSNKSYSFSVSNLEPGKYLYRLRMIDNDGTFQLSNVVQVEVKLPNKFSLSQNYPNPFNPSTKIKYELSVDANVLLEIFSIKGEKITCLVSEFKKAGFYELDFKPLSVKNNLPSGIYFYRLFLVESISGNKVNIIRKMLYLK